MDNKYDDSGFLTDGEGDGSYAEGFNDYPANEGIPELKNQIVDWLQRRYSVYLDPQKNILALNGTREGLYNSLIALCPEQKNNSRPVILIPNPFYQLKDI